MATLSSKISSVLITGGNRGLGLGMVKHILNSSAVSKHIIATCRSLKAENAQELKTLAEKNSNLHVLECDLGDVSAARLPELVKQVSDIVQESGLNLLINNAGMRIIEEFEDTSIDALRSTYEVNIIAPVMITKAFLPLLKHADDVKQGNQPKAIVVNISSGLGSIAMITNALKLAYKVSKAGLNMVTKAFSSEVAEDGIAVVSIDPGWVKTDMGGGSADLTIDESVTAIFKIISSLQMPQTGSFFKYDGTIMPW